jgi:hypothetical protein
VKDLKGRPFALLGIHVGGVGAAELKRTMDKEKLPWRSFVDPGQAAHGPIAKQWNHSATPTFYLLDPKGVILRKWVGPPGEKALDAAIEAALRDAEK